MPDLPHPSDLAAAAHTLDALGRTGATHAEFGYHEDTERWWAAATFRGAKALVDDQGTPVAALLALYAILAAGGTCTGCDRPVALWYGTGKTAELTVRARMHDDQLQTVRAPLRAKRRYCVRRLEPDGWNACRRVRAAG